MTVKFKNTHFDPDITPFHAQAKQMASTFGYTAILAIDNNLAQLLRLRVAQYNRCSYCVILHSKTAREVGIQSEKIDNLISWQHSELYSRQEQAALNYSDALCEHNITEFEQIHSTLAEYFNELEIAEIAAIVINMNVWTRLKLAQGQIPYNAD